MTLTRNLGAVVLALGLAVLVPASLASAKSSGKSADHRQDAAHGHHGGKGGNSADHRHDGAHGHKGHKGGKSGDHKPTTQPTDGAD